MSVTIRKCTMKDLEALQEISIETYEETFGAYNSEENMSIYLRDAYNLPKLKRELTNPQSHFYFIYWQEQLAGYLKLNFGEAQTEQVASSALEVERIYIRSSFKRKKLGYSLIQKALREAQNKGLETIWLGVWEHNDAARTFYARQGFRQQGAHSFFMGDDEQRDLIMVRSAAEAM